MSPAKSGNRPNQYQLIHVKKVAVIFFFLGLALFVIADDPTLDESEWRKLTEDVDYTEQKRDAPSVNWPNLGLNIDSEVIKYVFFTIIVGVLIYVLIKYVIALQSAGVKEDDDPGIEVSNLAEAEANPMKADLKKLIDKLVEEQDFRGAVRAYFLLILQRMHKKRLIVWSKPKTNFDYVREVRKQAFHSDFVDLTTVFEHVWYGEHHVDRARFLANEERFKQLLAKLPNE